MELKEGEFVTLDDDLAGFWDMVCLQIDDIQAMFDTLQKMRANEWKIEAKPAVGPVKKKTAAKSSTTATSSLNKAKPAALADSSSKTGQTSNSKARAEAARQRLIEAKKNAMRQKEMMGNGAIVNGHIEQQPI